MKSHVYLNDETLERLKEAVESVEEGEGLRVRMKEADPNYIPPEAGTIDSTLYLLNLKAYLGGFVGPLLTEILEAREEASRSA